MVKHPKIVMTLKYFQIFWFCVWKCEKECVKMCGNLKSWIPSHRRFHRYLKLQNCTYIAKVMIILSFSKKYISHTHKIVARHLIAIWGLRSAWNKKLKKTDPRYFSKKLGSVFFNFLIQALLRPQIAIRRCATISRVNFSRIGLLQIKISDNFF